MPYALFRRSAHQCSDAASAAHTHTNRPLLPSLPPKGRTEIARPAQCAEYARCDLPYTPLSPMPAFAFAFAFATVTDGHWKRRRAGARTRERATYFRPDDVDVDSAIHSMHTYSATAPAAPSYWLIDAAWATSVGGATLSPLSRPGISRQTRLVTYAYTGARTSPSWRRASRTVVSKYHSGGGGANPLRERGRPKDPEPTAVRAGPLGQTHLGFLRPPANAAGRAHRAANTPARRGRGELRPHGHAPPLLLLPSLAAVAGSQLRLLRTIAASGERVRNLSISGTSAPARHVYLEHASTDKARTAPGQKRDGSTCRRPQRDGGICTESTHMRGRGMHSSFCIAHPQAQHRAQVPGTLRGRTARIPPTVHAVRTQRRERGGGVAAHQAIPARFWGARPKCKNEADRGRGAPFAPS